MASGSTASPTRETPISERFATVALIVERYLLPWAYVWFAYSEITQLDKSYRQFRSLIDHGVQVISWPLFWARAVPSVLLACLSCFIAFTLLLSRRVSHPPKKLAHIVVPLAMSYYFFLYPLVLDPSVRILPPDLQVNFMPEDWEIPAAVTALVLSSIGYAIAIWGLCYLRRSFAVFVAVRQMVSGGPYVYVRHPMYLGYVIELAGLLLASLSLGMVVLAFGFVLLTMTRAKLEEQRLLEACPEYREYMQRTGFIFPRLGRRGNPGN